MDRQNKDICVNLNIKFIGNNIFKVYMNNELVMGGECYGSISDVISLAFHESKDKLINDLRKQI